MRANQPHPDQFAGYLEKMFTSDRLQDISDNLETFSGKPHFQVDELKDAFRQMHAGKGVGAEGLVLEM